MGNFYYIIYYSIFLLFFCVWFVCFWIVWILVFTYCSFLLCVCFKDPQVVLEHPEVDDTEDDPEYKVLDEDVPDYNDLRYDSSVKITSMHFTLSRC